MLTDPSASQTEVCQRFGAAPDAPARDSRLGVEAKVREPDVWPLNGLRHPAEHGTNGWYLWAGDSLSDAADVFEPTHTFHLEEWRPEALRYLALPPGWRFLVAPDHEDVWYDESLLGT